MSDGVAIPAGGPAECRGCLSPGAACTPPRPGRARRCRRRAGIGGYSEDPTFQISAGQSICCINEDRSAEKFKIASPELICAPFCLSIPVSAVWSRASQRRQLELELVLPRTTIYSLSPTTSHQNPRQNLGKSRQNLKVLDRWFVERLYIVVRGTTIEHYLVLVQRGISSESLANLACAGGEKGVNQRYR